MIHHPNGFDFDALQRAFIAVRRHARDGLKRVQTTHHLAEDRVLTVQTGHIAKHEVELAIVRKPLRVHLVTATSHRHRTQLMTAFDLRRQTVLTARSPLLPGILIRGERVARLN